MVPTKISANVCRRARKAVFLEGSLVKQIYEFFVIASCFQTNLWIMHDGSEMVRLEEICDVNVSEWIRAEWRGRDFVR